jgi:hypothetical protein
MMVLASRALASFLAISSRDSVNLLYGIELLLRSGLDCNSAEEFRSSGVQESKDFIPESTRSRSFSLVHVQRTSFVIKNPATASNSCSLSLIQPSSK